MFYSRTKLILCFLRLLWLNQKMKTIGIVAHSAEGAALCFLTACREGGRQLGPHMHPPIVMSAVPLALSMPGWETGNHEDVAKFLSCLLYTSPSPRDS